MKFLMVTLLTALMMFIPPAAVELQASSVVLLSDKNGPLFKPDGTYEPFNAYLYISDACYQITGLEYQLIMDPQHAHPNEAVYLLDYSLPGDNILDIGDPLSGHAVAFQIPLDGCSGPQLVCTMTMMTTLDCSQIQAFPLKIGPNPDSGYLRGTYLPDHDYFYPDGLESLLCPYAGYPELTDVTALSPKCLKVSFNTNVCDINSFSVCRSNDQADSIPVTSYSMETCTVACSCPDYCTGEGPFILYLESPMEDGADYTVDADANGHVQCRRWVSSLSFTFQGGFSPAPDLAASYLINERLGFSTCTFVDYCQFTVFRNPCQTYQIKYSVTNNGDLAAGPFAVRLFFEDHFNRSSSITVHTDSLTGLQAGETFTDTINVLQPENLWLLNDFGVEADYLDQISEWSEMNNQLRMVYGYHRPWIISISDIPDDYGGAVELTFHASRDEECVTSSSDFYYIKRLNSATGNYEEVEMIEASGDSIYTMSIPTECDSGEVDDYMNTFTVTYDREYHPGYSSCPDSGYSVNDRGGTAVLVQEYSASYNNEGITLRWRIASSRNLNYSISRSESGGDFSVISGAEIRVQDGRFRFSDTALRPGCIYRYRVEYVNTEGEKHLLFESEPVTVPRLELTLEQNYPNPFNPSTRIRFFMPERGNIVLEIFDVSGRLVRTLERGTLRPGWHETEWNGRGRSGTEANSGIYFCRLKMGKKVLSRKMLLMR